MTPDQLRKIAEAATKGPWEAFKDANEFPADFGPIYEWLIVNGDEDIILDWSNGTRREDAEFIATFNPQRVLELLDQIEQLQAVVRDQHDDCVYQARLAAVEEVHERREYWTETGEDICDTCSRRKQGDFVYWPCDTIKAARGE